MKKHFKNLPLLATLALLLIVSCSKRDDSTTDNPVGGDAFRMQVMTIDLPSTSLPNSEYHGSIGNTEITLTKGDEHKLIFMVPSTIALGNQNLIINDLNNMNIIYNVKDVVLPDTPDAVISPFQSNLNTFQTTSVNMGTQNATTSFNLAYSNASAEDKIKFASLYYANKALFDDIILNDYSNVSGRSLLGSMQLLFKHKLAVIAMVGGALMVIYGDPITKVAGAVLLGVGAYKAKVFGDNFVQLAVNSINLGMGGVLGVNNKGILSGLQLQNDVAKSVSFTTLDRTILDTDSIKDNSGSKLYFTYNTMYNDLVQQANPKIKWLNDNVPFCNFNLIQQEIVPSSSATSNNPVDEKTLSHLTLSITDPSLSLVSYSLASSGQLNIKVKINGTSTTSVNSALNYTFSDEFSTFSGSFPIKVSTTSPCDDTTAPYPTVTIGSQVWMQKNLNVCKYRNGDDIPEVQDYTAWANLTTGAWCYTFNDTANGPVYGKLYNWYAVNDPRGLAPTGYHIPNYAEWTTLINFLGGESVAGNKMKSTTGWLPSAGIINTNSSGFTGLPGGMKDGTYNSGFSFLGYGGMWWSASENDSFYASSLSMFDSESAAYLEPMAGKVLGFSVRCVKD